MAEINQINRNVFLNRENVSCQLFFFKPAFKKLFFQDFHPIKISTVMVKCILKWLLGARCENFVVFSRDEANLHEGVSVGFPVCPSVTFFSPAFRSDL